MTQSSRRLPDPMSDSSDSLRDTILRLLVRDLEAMQLEIAAYLSDEALWSVPTGVANSGGTLALHLAGNLRHFVGAVLGGSGYVRDRAYEFSARGLTRATVIAELADAQSQVVRTLRALDSARLLEPFPEAVGETQLRTDAFLLHLATHLTYHMGQVDYHRRLTTQTNTTVRTLNLPAMLRPTSELSPS